MHSKLKYSVPFLFLFFLSTTNVSAQVSYDRTITYIESSLENLEDISRVYDEKFTYYLTDFTFAYYATDRNRIIMKYKRVFSDNTSDKFQYIFNPKHIVSISKLTEKSTDGFFFAQVQLTGPLGIKVVTTDVDVESSISTFNIPYISGDTKSFLRLKAALENLKLISLVRDSNDPFAN